MSCDKISAILISERMYLQSSILMFTQIPLHRHIMYGFCCFVFCFLFKLVFVFRKKIKTVFESDHKNTPSIAMSIWSRTVILILDAFKAARSSNHSMVTNLFFLGASLDFPMIKLHDVEF